MGLGSNGMRLWRMTQTLLPFLSLDEQSKFDGCPESTTQLVVVWQGQFTNLTLFCWYLARGAQRTLPESGPSTNHFGVGGNRTLTHGISP